MPWNLINATFIPGVALEDPPQREEGTLCGAMLLERLQRIG